MRIWVCISVIATLGAPYDIYLNSFETDDILVFQSGASIITLYGPLAVAHSIVARIGRKSTTDST